MGVITDTQPLPIPVTRKKKVMSPIPPTMKPGTMKDHPQGELGVVAQNEGIIAPRMFPTRARELHMPSRSPRLDRKNQKGGVFGITHFKG